MQTTLESWILHDYWKVPEAQRAGKPAAGSILLRLRLTDYAIKSSKILPVWDCQPPTFHFDSFPKGGKRSAFLRRTSTSFSTLSIKEFQNPRSLDKRPRLKQMPVDGIS
nr:hypothetical protein CFP56_63829 [Quercus suber]